MTANPTRPASAALGLFTIGFTRKSAERFFTLLRDNGVKRVVDVRLSNVSQLSGFAKRDDLKWFLGEIAGIGYEHMPDLAPTRGILDGYRKNHRDWSLYEKQFLGLMRERRIEEREGLQKSLAGACLLCSEDKPHHCHRRLVADYLGEHWGDINVIHLG